MTETKKETQEKPKIELPQLHFRYLGCCDIYTEKGTFLWLVPAGLNDIDEIIKYLDFAKSKYIEQKEINRKKQEEEDKKNVPSAAANKKSEYKSV